MYSLDIAEGEGTKHYTFVALMNMVGFTLTHLQGM
jgi:hypothetical protein